MFYHLIYPMHVYVSGLNIFRYITVRAAFAAVTAFFITIMIGGFVIKILREYKIGQIIRREGPKKHLQKEGTPTMGGLLILFSFLAGVLLWGRLDNPYVQMGIFSAVWFGLIGLLDDWLKLKIGTKGLNANGKLVLQFMGAFLITGWYTFIIQAGSETVTLLTVPFVKSPLMLPAAVFIIFAVLIIVGWSNAVNLTDGLDGLATGLSLMVFAALTILAYVAGNFRMSEYLLIQYVPMSGELAVVCAAFAGALLGFLWFNAYPAQVFMGDVGALMLGGVIGTVTVIIKQEILLLMVGLVFVIELASVVIQVTSYKMTKKRVFKMAPLHHHFQLKGMSEPKIIIRFWIAGIIVLLIMLATLKLR